MADPKLQIEQRVERCEKAIGTMAAWLVQAQTGFGAQDAEGIEKILRGEDVKEPNDRAT
jgi:TRAP-type mannitol/chloroaromatic compound transport system permease small subunit